MLFFFRQKLSALVRIAESTVIGFVSAQRELPLQIDITNLCNLRCTHCYHPNHKNDGALSLSQWFAILHQYKSLIARLHFTPKVIICGGEPLTSPMLAPILEFLKLNNLHSKVSILTNGTLLRNFNFETFNGIDDLTFQVSIDGPDSTSHDSARGSGSFNKSISGIRLLRSKGFKVKLLSVLSQRTATKIPDFFNLARSLDASEMNFTRLIVTGHAKLLVQTNSDKPLDPLDLRSSYEKIVAESLRTKVKTSLHQPLLRLLHPKLGSSGNFASALIVNYKGKLLASSRSGLIIGDALVDGLEQVFLTSPTLIALREGKIETCGACPMLRACGGDRNAAFAHSGNFLGADPACWKNINPTNPSYTPFKEKVIS